MPPDEQVLVVQTFQQYQFKPVDAASLIFLIAKGNGRSHSENVSFRSRLVLIVKTNGAVWAEVVSISRLGWESALDSVHPASCDHFSLSINDQIDFFGGLVMMGKVCSSWCEVHQEKAGDHVCIIDRITFSVSWADQKLVQN